MYWPLEIISHVLIPPRGTVNSMCFLFLLFRSPLVRVVDFSKLVHLFANAFGYFFFTFSNSRNVFVCFCIHHKTDTYRLHKNEWYRPHWSWLYRCVSTRIRHLCHVVHVALTKLHTSASPWWWPRCWPKQCWCAVFRVNVFFSHSKTAQQHCKAHILITQHDGLI